MGSCCNPFRMQTECSAGPYKTRQCRLNNTSPDPFLCVVNMTDDAQSLAEQRGTSVHATEALLCNFREQKIKEAMASSYIAPGALEGKYSQIYDLHSRPKGSDLYPRGWNTSVQTA
jgi:hypothetical protein